MNQANLIGRVTRVPELKKLPNGTTVVNIGLATNRAYKDANGNKKEQVTFHNLKAFGRLADVLGQYVVKGQRMFFTGRIDNRTWDTPEGTKGHASEIIIDGFEFLDKPRDVDGVSRPAPAASQGDVRQSDGTVEAVKDQFGGEEEIDLASIPF